MTKLGPFRQIYVSKQGDRFLSRGDNGTQKWVTKWKSDTSGTFLWVSVRRVAGDDPGQIRRSQTVDGLVGIWTSTTVVQQSDRH